MGGCASVVRCEVLVEVGDRLAYTYDFGDGWDHTIRLEAVLPRADDAPRVRCTAGRRACPPEDVGGVPGFAVLLDVLADPAAARRDPELADLLEWLESLYGGEGFDPAAFDVEQADAAVRAALDDAALDLSLLPPAVAELLERATGPGRRTLVRLVAGAGLGAPETPLTGEESAALAAAHRRLLDLVGTDGVQLSKAGYLPPAVVRELIGVVDPHHHWLSTSDREADYYPVLLFRQGAQRLRLVRTLKGRLVLTPAGRKVRGGDAALVAHLAAALPLAAGPPQRDAGLLVLLAAAAGEVVDRSSPTDGGEARAALVPAMDSLGWSVGDGSALSEADVRYAAQETLDVLRTVGALPARGAGGADVTTGAGERFARAALRG